MGLLLVLPWQVGHIGNESETVTTSKGLNLGAATSVAFGVLAVALGLCGLTHYGMPIAIAAFVPASIAVVLGQVGLARGDKLGGSGGG